VKKSRRRYVLFTLHFEGAPVSEKGLVNAIRNNLLSLYGEIAVADSKLFLNEYDEKSGVGILQCSGLMLDSVMAAAALLSFVDKTKVSFEPRKTSGTIKSLTSKIKSD
jgi:RNase P/RNase MRP subunit POP5